jgi:hypothetical protein
VLHHVKVDPVRVFDDDVGLQVRVRRVVGYRFTCSCGEAGSRRSTHAVARLDGIVHREVAEVDRDARKV